VVEQYLAFVVVEDLWGDVAGGTATLEEGILGAPPAGQPKIAEHEFAGIGAVSDHDVLEFEVTVHDAALTEVLEGLGDVLERLPLLCVGGELVLSGGSCTFLSSWKRLPQGRYSSTWISYFRWMYTLSSEMMFLCLRIRSSLASLMKIS
jgi:hypothetical protein